MAEPYPEQFYSSGEESAAFMSDAEVTSNVVHPTSSVVIASVSVVAPQLSSSTPFDPLAVSSDTASLHPQEDSTECKLTNMEPASVGNQGFEPLAETQKCFFLAFASAASTNETSPLAIDDALSQEMVNRASVKGKQAQSEFTSLSEGNVFRSNIPETREDFVSREVCLAGAVRAPRCETTLSSPPCQSHESLMHGAIPNHNNGLKTQLSSVNRKELTPSQSCVESTNRARSRRARYCRTWQALKSFQVIQTLARTPYWKRLNIVWNLLELLADFGMSTSDFIFGTTRTDRFDNALGVMVTNVHAWNAGFIKGSTLGILKRGVSAFWKRTWLGRTIIKASRWCCMKSISALELVIRIFLRGGPFVRDNTLFRKDTMILVFRIICFPFLCWLYIMANLFTLLFNVLTYLRDNLTETSKKAHTRFSTEVQRHLKAFNKNLAGTGDRIFRRKPHQHRQKQHGSDDDDHTRSDDDDHTRSDDDDHTSSEDGEFQLVSIMQGRRLLERDTPRTPRGIIRVIVNEQYRTSMISDTVPKAPAQCPADNVETAPCGPEMSPGAKPVRRKLTPRKRRNMQESDKISLGCPRVTSAETSCRIPACSRLTLWQRVICLLRKIRDRCFGMNDYKNPMTPVPAPTQVAFVFRSKNNRTLNKYGESISKRKLDELYPPKGAFYGMDDMDDYESSEDPDYVPTDSETTTDSTECTDDSLDLCDELTLGCLDGKSHTAYFNAMDDSQMKIRQDTSRESSLAVAQSLPVSDQENRNQETEHQDLENRSQETEHQDQENQNQETEHQDQENQNQETEHQDQENQNQETEHQDQLVAEANQKQKKKKRKRSCASTDCQHLRKFDNF